MKRLKTNFMFFVWSLKEKVFNKRVVESMLMQSAFPQEYWSAGSQIIFAMSEGSSFVFAWLKSICYQKGYDSWVVSQWSFHIHVRQPRLVLAYVDLYGNGNWIKICHRTLIIKIFWFELDERPDTNGRSGLGSFYRQLILPSSAWVTAGPEPVSARVLARLRFEKSRRSGQINIPCHNICGLVLSAA